MRKASTIVLMLTVVAIAPISSSMASEKHDKKTALEHCEAAAARDKVSAEKKDKYIKACVDKHSKKK